MTPVPSDEVCNECNDAAATTVRRFAGASRYRLCDACAAYWDRERLHTAPDPLVRCYVCTRMVPKSLTWKARHRVPSGVVRTPDPFTYRIVRKCNPTCAATEGADR